MQCWLRQSIYIPLSKTWYEDKWGHILLLNRISKMVWGLMSYTMGGTWNSRKTTTQGWEWYVRKVICERRITQKINMNVHGSSEKLLIIIHVVEITRSIFSHPSSWVVRYKLMWGRIIIKTNLYHGEDITKIECGDQQNTCIQNQRQWRLILWMSLLGSSIKEFMITPVNYLGQI